MNRRTLLRWMRHQWRSWQARRSRRILAFLDRVLLDQCEIAARHKNELLDDLVFEAHDGPYVPVVKTPLPTVRWRKP